MTEKKYSRKISYNERLFLAADEICPPVLNQLFFEGEGSFDISKWRDAVELASEANPGSRLILRGHLGASRWIDSGVTPQVIEVDGKDWDGRSPEGAPFLQKRLMPRQGPTCEILLINSKPMRVCFRSHHAVMDGRGSMTWVEDVFRALRGENVYGSSSTISDLELVRSIQKEYRVPFSRDNIAPTGAASEKITGVTWKRLTIPGRYRNFLGQVAILVANESWKNGQGPVRFAIPVDLRTHQKELRSTCNLSIAIYVEVSKDSTPESITLDIKNQLDEKRDCMIDKWDPLIRYLPMRFLVSKGKSMIKNNSTKGEYGTSGILTNMGKVSVTEFSGGGFNSNAFWGITPSLESVPFFLGLTTRDEFAELVLTMPRNLADNCRITDILDNIQKGLVPA